MGIAEKIGEVVEGLQAQRSIADGALLLGAKQPFDSLMHRLGLHG